MHSWTTGLLTCVWTQFWTYFSVISQPGTLCLRIIWVITRGGDSFNRLCIGSCCLSETVLGPVCAKSLQLCLTLYSPMDYSPPGSSAHGILQARILSQLPCPLPGDLPESGIKPTSPRSPALEGELFTTNATRETLVATLT